VGLIVTKCFTIKKIIFFFNDIKKWCRQSLIFETSVLFKVSSYKVSENTYLWSTGFVWWSLVRLGMGMLDQMGIDSSWSWVSNVF
jgi:hypothetical protein